MQDPIPQSRAFRPVGPLRGTALVPGDKSISHRALILAGLASGRSHIGGLSEGRDVLATAASMRAFGARIVRDDDTLAVDGLGGALLQPQAALAMGNSGTSARLLMGLAATRNLTATFTGDPSLSRRPMSRIIAPLRRLGADITAAPGGRLPLTVRGLHPAAPLLHPMEVASAQVKSALLLAGLNTPGITRILEPVPTRDHSERMLSAFGAELEVEEAAGGRMLCLRGEGTLRAQTLSVPGDPSAAAFLLVAALIVPGSEILIQGVGINPTRAGLFEVLREMGADLRLANHRVECGEPVADIAACHSHLRSVDVPPEFAPSMIDEYPIFFIAAAFAHGTSRTSGLSELRVKESDRLATMARGFGSLGMTVEETTDGLAITGTGGEPLPGGTEPIDPEMDHRIAMSFAVAGLHCRASLTIADMSPAGTSFPRFAETLEGLAA